LLSEIMHVQTGPHPTKWDKTGVVIEVKQFDQYIIKVDGSGIVTQRNRKFLRKFFPVITLPPTCTLHLRRLTFLNPTRNRSCSIPPLNLVTRLQNHSRPLRLFNPHQLFRDHCWTHNACFYATPDACISQSSHYLNHQPNPSPSQCVRPGVNPYSPQGLYHGPQRLKS
jgi:hypothetical protein